MTFDYAQAAADALELLEEFGQEIVIRAKVTATYDVTTSKNTKGTEDRPAIGALLSFPANRTQSDTKEDETAIRSTDKKLLVSPVGLASAPQTSDKAIVQSVTYNIVTVKAIEPAGVPVLYILQVRK